MFNVQIAVDAYVISQIIGGLVAGFLIALGLCAAFSKSERHK